MSIYQFFHTYDCYHSPRAAQMIDFTSSIIIEKLCNFYTDNITHLSLNGKQALGETKNKGMLLVRTGADAIIHTGRGGGA